MVFVSVGPPEVIAVVRERYFKEPKGFAVPKKILGKAENCGRDCKEVDGQQEPFDRGQLADILDDQKKRKAVKGIVTK